MIPPHPAPPRKRLGADRAAWSVARHVANFVDRPSSKQFALFDALVLQFPSAVTQESSATLAYGVACNDHIEPLGAGLND